MNIEHFPEKKVFQTVVDGETARLMYHDLTDNMDVRRMPCIGEKEVTRLRKYLKAYHRLMPLYMNH